MRKTFVAALVLAAPLAWAQEAKSPKIAVIDMGRVSAESLLGKGYSAQLEAINQDDYERAHSYFSARLRELRSAEEFRSFVQENIAVLKTTDSTFSNRKIENNVATLRGTLTGRDGRTSPVRYVLVKENDRVGTPSDCFGELAALLVTNVSGRSTDQARG